MATLANQRVPEAHLPLPIILQLSWKNKPHSSQMEGSQREKTLIQQVLLTPSALESFGFGISKEPYLACHPYLDKLGKHSYSSSLKA